MHGGAGDVRAGDAAFAEAARGGLLAALEAGAAILAAGGAALEAVAAAAVALEDCPVFNAGTGSVLNAEGEVEMDAAVMEGASRRVGAVAGLHRVKNPALAALAVLRDGRHVLLAGPGAEAFAEAAGVELVKPESLVTDQRREQWRRRAQRPAAATAPGGGTVGAVARDRAGHLAAATSTGGILGKLPGRVSDSALVGSGTFADDATCAVSATGRGEIFIRAIFAARVDAAMRAGLALDAACRAALSEVAALGGSGGCVAVDRGGRLALPFDTPGMPRAALREGEPPRLALVADPGI